MQRINELVRETLQPPSVPSGTPPILTRRKLLPPDERICPMCKGMEWMIQDWDNQLMRCPVCATGQQYKVLVEQCGLSDEMRGWTFASSRRVNGTKAAHEAGEWLAKHPAWLLTLHGPNGVGKTRLMACICNAGIAEGWPSVYVTTAQVLDHLRRAYDPGTGEVTFDGMWERLVKARILCLDEVDRWNPTEWAREKFFELVDLRYRNGSQCLTVFATNASLDSAPDYLVSRMRDGRSRVFDMSGPDLRRVQH